MKATVNLHLLQKRNAERRFIDGGEWCDSFQHHTLKYYWMVFDRVTNDIHWITQTLESLLGGTRSIH
jgi:hypothetical protein